MDHPIAYILALPRCHGSLTIIDIFSDGLAYWLRCESGFWKAGRGRKGAKFTWAISSIREIVEFSSRNLSTCLIISLHRSQVKSRPVWDCGIVDWRGEWQTGKGACCTCRRDKEREKQCKCEEKHVWFEFWSLSFLAKFRRMWTKELSSWLSPIGCFRLFSEKLFPFWIYRFPFLKSFHKSLTRVP